MKTPDLPHNTDHWQYALKIKNQTEILYSQSVVTYIFPLLAALCLIPVLWTVANHIYLLSWLGLVIIFTLFRYMVLLKYYKTEISPETTYRWLTYFIMMAAISGLIWGVAGIVLIPYDPDSVQEFTLYNGLIILAVAGLVSGAVISYSVNFWVLFYYSFPALIPPAIYLIFLGDKYNSAFGGLILLYYFYITVASYRMNKQYSYYIDMEFQKEDLEHKYKKLQFLLAELQKGRK